MVIPVKKLEKTQSGKIQRLKMEKQFLAGEYDDLLGLYNIKKDSSDLDEADVESSILNIWKNVLNNANIKSDDNFLI